MSQLTAFYTGPFPVQLVLVEQFRYVFVPPVVSAGLRSPFQLICSVVAGFDDCRLCEPLFHLFIGPEFVVTGWFADELFPVLSVAAAVASAASTAPVVLPPIASACELLCKNERIDI